MPIKYNNFDIGNAYLGNDNLVAMYQGSNLVWTNGIKLKVVNNVIKGTKYGFVDLGTLNYDGFQSGDLYAIASYQLRGIIKSSGVEHTANIYVEDYEVKGAWYSPVDKCIKVQLDDGTIYLYDSRYSSATDFKNSLKGKYLIYELDQPDGNTLDTLTAQQVYDLLTLNGTDFTNLELLGAGYEIKLGSFKSQETNTVDLGDFIYGNAGYTDNVVRVIATVGLENRQEMGEATLSPNNKINYVDYGLGVSDSESGNLSTKTYSYFLYIVLSKSAIGWTNSDGDAVLSDRVRDYLRGIKLTYELANKNNIAGSKYGFVKLKDLTWYLDPNGYNFFYAKLETSKGYQSKNIFCEKYKTTSTAPQYFNDKEITTFWWSSAQDICIKDTQYSNENDFKNSLTDDDILVFELEHLLGNKLDNYTAEQVYYMFFATLGMSKMYVPQGVRFESSDNIILGTKYGIVDLGDLNYSYQSGNNRFYSSGIQSVVKYTQSDTASVPNIHIDGLEVISLNTMGSGTTHDYSITIYNGLIFVRVLQYTQPNDLINSLKGKYLIYELSSPNGTDYNDLSAKEMYDVINSNTLKNNLFELVTTGVINIGGLKK